MWIKCASSVSRDIARNTSTCQFTDFYKMRQKRVKPPSTYGARHSGLRIMCGTYLMENLRPHSYTGSQGFLGKYFSFYQFNSIGQRNGGRRSSNDCIHSPSTSFTLSGRLSNAVETTLTYYRFHAAVIFWKPFSLYTALVGMFVLLGLLFKLVVFTLSAVVDRHFSGNRFSFVAMTDRSKIFHSNPLKAFHCSKWLVKTKSRHAKNKCVFQRRAKFTMQTNNK